MSNSPLAKLPQDLLESAFPGCDPLTREENFQSILEAANAIYNQPSPYNSLHDKHMKGYFERPKVKEFLQKAGFINENGTSVLTKEELRLTEKAKRLLIEREEILVKLQRKEKERLEKLYISYKPGKVPSAADESVAKQLRTIQETKRKLFLLRARTPYTLPEAQTGANDRDQLPSSEPPTSKDCTQSEGRTGSNVSID